MPHGPTELPDNLQRQQLLHEEVADETQHVLHASLDGQGLALEFVLANHEENTGECGGSLIFVLRWKFRVTRLRSSEHACTGFSVSRLGHGLLKHDFDDACQLLSISQLEVVGQHAHDVSEVCVLKGTDLIHQGLGTARRLHVVFGDSVKGLVRLQAQLFHCQPHLFLTHGTAIRANQLLDANIELTLCCFLYLPEGVLTSGFMGR